MAWKKPSKESSGGPVIGPVLPAQPKIPISEPVVQPAPVPSPPPLPASSAIVTPGEVAPEPVVAPTQAVSPGAPEPVTHTPSFPPPAFTPATISDPLPPPPALPSIPTMAMGSMPTPVVAPAADADLSRPSLPSERTSDPPMEISASQIVVPPPSQVSHEPLLTVRSDIAFGTGGKIELNTSTLLLKDVEVTVSRSGSTSFDVYYEGNPLGSLTSIHPLSFDCDVDSGQAKVTLLVHDLKVYAYTTAGQSNIPYSQLLSAGDCDCAAGIEVFVLPESTSDNAMLFVRDKIKSQVYEIDSSSKLVVDVVNSQNKVVSLSVNVDSSSLDVSINEKSSTPKPIPPVAPPSSAPVAKPASAPAIRPVAPLPAPTPAPLVTQAPRPTGYTQVGPAANTAVGPFAASASLGSDDDWNLVTPLPTASLGTTSAPASSTTKVSLSELLYNGKSIELTDNSKFEVTGDRNKVVFSVSYAGGLLRVSRNNKHQDAQVDTTDEQTLTVGDIIVSLTIVKTQDKLSVCINSVKDVPKPESAFKAYLKRLVPDVPTGIGMTAIYGTIVGVNLDHVISNTNAAIAAGVTTALYLASGLIKGSDKK